MDSAFFSDAIVSLLDGLSIEFTISVPFERYARLKELAQNRKRWWWMSADQGYFESSWKPACWSKRYRFLFIRSKVRKQCKLPVQQDIFRPYETGYDFKVIVTNKQISARKVVSYHNGRGMQEGIFAELKSQVQMDYVPTRKKAGNQVYTYSAIMAHNLNRELQMRVCERDRNTTEKRSPLWQFTQLSTIRRRIIQRAGRLTRPGGKLTLTMSANDAVKEELSFYLDGLKAAA